MKTNKFSKLMLVAALAVLAAALVGGPGAAASSRVETLRGVCNLEGTTAVSTYSFGSSRESSASHGTCIASVNGEPIRTHRVRLVTQTVRPLIDLRSRGTGSIRVEGYERRLRFGFQRVAGRVLAISGAAGSRARATLHRRSGDRHLIVLEAGDQLYGR